MKLGRHEIGPDRTFIIAEAGTNFSAVDEKERETNINLYCMMAASAGSDAIKFQLFVPGEPLFCPVPGDDARWQRWAQTLLPVEKWATAKRLAEAYGMVFLASAFQPTAVRWLNGLEVEAYKVASRAFATFPYKDAAGPFIVSINCDGPDDPWAHAPNDSLLMHCRPVYPAPFEAASLFRDTVEGLSDHTGNIWAGLHAITHRASMLEVHFSIHDDKHDAGNDAPVCLTIEQLRFLCSARDALASLG